MTTNDSPAFDRRTLLRLSALGLASQILPARLRAQTLPSASATTTDKDRKLLFVVCAYGGASIIDSFLPVSESEAGLAGMEINCYPDALVEQRPGSNIRSVKLLDAYSYFAKPARAMGELVANHGADMAVICHDVSSVNHTVGQQRSLNAAGLDRGRTIMEIHAERYGLGLPLASCNMATEGYLRHGVDPSVSRASRHEPIRVPALFGAGTHGFLGVAGAPAAAAIERARGVRDALDAQSVFGQTFVRDTRLSAYLQSRRETLPTLERAQLFDKLLLARPAGAAASSSAAVDPLSATLNQTFPRIAEDRMEAQVALAFLLAYYGVSASVALGFDTEPVVHSDNAIVGTPLSFDFSHNMHRVVQNLMWARTASLVDALITLLKTHDYLGDPALGKMWDRSLVYIATEFGRDKKKPFLSSSWGTGHDLNNGSVLLSPMLKGNSVYGGVDPQTGLTYGFDPATGKPDKQRVMGEVDVYGIIAQALALDTTVAKQYAGIVR